MRTMHALLSASAALALGCSHRGDLVYTSFGAADPAADSRIVKTWEKSRVKTESLDQVDALGRQTKQTWETRREPTETERRSVVVLVDTIPEGIESSQAGLRSTGPHVVVGKFYIRYKGDVEKNLAVDDVKLVAIAAGANMALISWAGGSQESTWGVSGVIIRYDLTKFDPAKSQSAKIVASSQQRRGHADPGRVE